MSKFFVFNIIPFALLILAGTEIRAGSGVIAKVEVISQEIKRSSQSGFIFDDRPDIAIIVDENIVAFNSAVSLARELYHGRSFRTITVCNASAVGSVDLLSCVQVITIGGEGDVFARLGGDNRELYILLPSGNPPKSKLPTFCGLVLLDRDGHASTTRAWSHWAAQSKVPIQRIDQKTARSLRMAFHQVEAKVHELRIEAER